MDLQETNQGKLRLASWEQDKITKVKSDPNTVGYSVITRRGNEIETKGLWEDTAPIISNLLDIADQIGRELGEDRSCNLMVSENADFELSSTFMENAHIISLRRKARAAVGGLHDAG